ncbi:MAG: phosphoglucosamine mutase [Oscillospiraceae bacterium]|nr:phosphoglucosamine mutase [Oscillospiraceae bacterium]MBR6739124.1 phosphoglucosamine mutase [Oscillospiraceae bacterium]
MGKLFGTDGIRGVVGENLTVELAFRTGQAIASVLKEEKGRAPLITIGKDTRISSDMLESALISGICSVGGNVMPFGVLPTPAVAYLTVRKEADAGIVISASHNPYEHNGIKVFNEKGYKLPDATEEKIEAVILSDEPVKVATRDEIGVLYHGLKQSKQEYIHYLARSIDNDLSGLRILVDCSNGAASATAPELFGRFKCYVDFIYREPNGLNINNNCGSTHLDALAKRVVDGKYDIGVAFDGDADRCLMVDEKGNVIDGDKIMAVCASYMKRNGRLDGNTIVATVMSNLGLHEFCKNNGIDLVCTAVGDRNVLEKMVECGYRIGGEQSGHMIFTEYATTGDGQLSALQFLEILALSDKSASELVSVCPQYPQVLLNVSVSAERGVKEGIMASEVLAAAIKSEEVFLNGEGRILVRASGTEALIRVMVEAKTTNNAQLVAERLVKVIKTL